MPLFIKQNNQWTKLNKFHNVNGTNKEILNQYHKVNGTWKPVYSYSWNTSEWSSCSKPCGTGIQTRTATCIRNDGVIKEDKFCTLSGINKPVLQQYCNSQPCATIVHMCGQADDELYIINQTTSNLIPVKDMQSLYIGNYYNPICKNISLDPNYFYGIDGVEYAYLELRCCNNYGEGFTCGLWSSRGCAQLISNPEGAPVSGTASGTGNCANRTGLLYGHTPLRCYNIFVRIPIIRII